MNSKTKRVQNFFYGHLAEHWVGVLMRLRGYRVICRRYRCIYGEIDLIVRRGKHLRFIEVKYRRDGGDDKIDQILPSPRSQMRIKKASLNFISKQGYGEDMVIHLDCVIVGRFGHSRWFWDSIAN